MDSYIAEFPNILDSFTGIANMTRTLVEVNGGVQWVDLVDLVDLGGYTPSLKPQ